MAETGAPSALNFRRILPQDGLPAAEIRGLIQDSRGFIWIGTYDGLVRYDGSEFRTFRHDARNTNSIANNVVWNITEDAQGDLWLATWSGLDKWDRHTERFIHHRSNPADVSSISDDVVRFLAPGEHGALWVGTSRGLNILDPATGKFRRILAGASKLWNISDSSVRALFRDSDGIVWVGTDAGGLNRIDPQTGEVTVFTSSPSSPIVLPSNFVSALAEDHDKNLWIGADKGVIRLDRSRTSATRFSKEELPLHPVDAILVDRDGIVWLGTDRGGLSWFDPTTRHFATLLSNPLDNTTLATEVVRTIYQDINGDFWIGHFPFGISYANRLASAIRHQVGPIPSSDPRQKQEVNGIWEDPNGDVWLATDHGVEHTIRATGESRRYQHNPSNPASLPTDTIETIYRDKHGRLWVGAYGGGLNLLLDDSAEKFKTYLPDPADPKSLPNPHVWHMTEDGDTNLWIATRGGGLARLLPDSSGFAVYRNDPADEHSINHNLVWHVMAARDGSIWVGTTAGIGHLPRGSTKWERYQHRDDNPTSLSHNWVVSLYEAKDGFIWAATEGGGLNRLDPASGKFIAFTSADGLPSDQARGIVAEDDNIFWILTNNGLSRFDRRSGRFQNFGEGEGLNSRLIFRGAGILSREQELMVGTARGINIVDPKLLVPNTNSPPVVITALEVANREVAPGSPDSPLRESISVSREIRLSSRLSVVTFRFAALNYRSPEKNQYSYRLDGFDDAWSTPGLRREATYTGLTPGAYAFRVAASNNEGQWNWDGATIAVVVLPQWWQTVWFRGGMLGLAGSALAWLGWFIPHRRLKEQLAVAQRNRAQAEERQRASEERESVLRSLREAQNRYRELLDSSDVGICILQAGRIVQPNKRLAQLTGVPLPELEGAQLAQFVHSKDIDKFNSALSKDFGKTVRESHHTLPFRIVRPNQPEVWTELNATSVQWEDQPGFLAILTDVTERLAAEAKTHALQQQLHQSQKLESLGTLAGGIAHDFNNILGAIIGHAELARQDAQANASIQECLTEVLKGGTRAKELVHQILLFSRRQKAERKPLQLQALVDEVLKLIRSTLPSTLEIVSDISPTAPAVLGDSTQIHQVLVNLCTNAAHSMEGRVGRLEVRLDEVSSDIALLASVPDLKPGRYCRLTVADNGHGMDEATQKRIFEPFFTTKKPGQGTGLGLSVVHGIVRDHEGAIKVYSEPGKGTVFTIFLPVAPTPALAEPAARERWPRGRGETVLLVDDEIAIGKSTAALLRRAGYVASTVTSAHEAFNLFAASPEAYNLVITDLTMPNMTGVELAVKILQLRPQQPVLLSSGFSEIWTDEKLRKLGLRGLLTKPFDSATLLARIQAIFDEARNSDGVDSTSS